MASQLRHDHELEVGEDPVFHGGDFVFDPMIGCPRSRPL